MEKWRCGMCGKTVTRKLCSCGNDKHFDALPMSMVDETESVTPSGVEDAEARTFEENADA